MLYEVITFPDINLFELNGTGGGDPIGGLANGKITGQAPRHGLHREVAYL